MLMILMYHQIVGAGHPEATKRFFQHLQYLAQNYTIATPGERLLSNKLTLCLTFDDAYFDFYHVVYPMLQKLNIKAVLGIPVKIIQEDTQLSYEQRLQLLQPLMEQTPYSDYPAFCNWTEIKEMVNSGLVIPASHSYSHINLAQADVDWQLEAVQSKHILQQKLNQPVDTFIYPFGAMNRQAHQQLIPHYQYIMRIGSALNYSWHNRNNILYRIDANHFWPHNKKWDKMKLLRYSIKMLGNIIKAK